jgi:hypothetical protein
MEEFPVRLITEWPLSGTRCSVCGELQYKVPGGDCCPQGHGGAPPQEQGGRQIVKPGTMEVVDMDLNSGVARLHVQITPRSVYPQRGNDSSRLYLTLLPIEALPEGAKPGSKLCIGWAPEDER